MSRVDNAWLRMDNDVNLMMIVGVWLLTPAITLAALRQRVSERLLQYPRFRQKVVHDATGPSWVDDPAFDIAEQVVAETLPRAAASEARVALQQRCAELAMLPLSPARPLWQFHLVAEHEQGSAIIMRIHHSMGDGIALMSVMNTLTDGGPNPPAPPAPPGHAEALDHEADWLDEAVIRPITALAVKALDLTGNGVSTSIDWLNHPQQHVAGTADSARHGLQLLSDMAALALMDDDSPTRLKGRPTGRKRVAWNEPIALDRVRGVGKGLGCSINDVLLATVSGAIGGWLREQGDDPSGKHIRAMVPVNLRPADEAWKLGNRFGLAPLVLPVGIENPVERLFDVHARMNALKHSYQPLLAYGLLMVSGAVVKPVQDLMLDFFAKKTTAVMTNVPGPREPLRFCGSTLRQTMFWVPASGHVGVGVSILSYAGGVQFGLITDEALCPEPQQIIDRFETEFERLLWLTLMLPWGDNAAA